jgi:hypothetical protein
MLAVADYAAYNIRLVISTVLARHLLRLSGYAGRPAEYSGWFSRLFRLPMQSMLPGYPGWIRWQIWLAVLVMMFGCALYDVCICTLCSLAMLKCWLVMLAGWV